MPRPGFHYGFGAQHLVGGGYPSNGHIKRVRSEVSVAVLKLHGSVSWSLRSGRLLHYHDCRPAIRGDALLVAPVRGKRPPDCLLPTWQLARTALESAIAVVSVGYSLPPYDDLVRDLLRATAPDAQFHVFDPNPAAGDHYRRQLGRDVAQHGGLPEALPDIAVLCDALAAGGSPV